MSKNYLEKITEYDPITKVGKEVRDVIKVIGEVAETNRKNSEKDHRDFIGTASNTNAKKASKKTDRSWGAKLTKYPNGTTTLEIGRKSEDTTEYER